MSTEQSQLHLTDEQALLMAEGDPLREEFKALAEHLTACRPCRRLVRSVEQVIDLFRQEHLPAVPSYLSARVLDLINEPGSASEPDRLPRAGILGRLIFERPIPLMSVRSGGATTGRVFRFNTDEESIDVTVYEIGAGMVNIRGTVLGVSEPSIVSFIPESGELVEASISDGSFSFENVRKQKAEMRIIFEDREITFDIDLN